MHGGEHALGAEAGIVDEAIDCAELVSQGLDEGRDRVGLAEIAGAKLQASGAALEVTHSVAELVALAPCQRDRVVAGSRHAARDGEPNAAAAPGDEDVTHCS